MKNVTLSILLLLGSGAVLVPTFASASSQSQTQVEVADYSDAQLDSLLAPIALYPDALLTHILIATTYPLDVIAADRWRQSNTHLTAQQVEQVITPISWDPSVKAIVPFTDILHTMAEDIDWMEQVGDNMLVNEDRVLDRIQVLRQHAYHSGNLRTNDYLDVAQESSIIYIAPRHRETIYVPYYNPTHVFGHWNHSIAPHHWHFGVSVHQSARIYWSPRVHLSTLFYFGGIHWHNRHLVVHRGPVTRYYRHTPVKRVYSKGYQRWNHNVDHRRARYSQRVTHTAPKRYQHKQTIMVNKPGNKHQIKTGTTNRHTLVRHSELKNKLSDNRNRNRTIRNNQGTIDTTRGNKSHKNTARENKSGNNQYREKRVQDKGVRGNQRYANVQQKLSRQSHKPATNSNKSSSTRHEPSLKRSHNSSNNRHSVSPQRQAKHSSPASRNVSRYSDKSHSRGLK